MYIHLTYEMYRNSLCITMAIETRFESLQLQDHRGDATRAACKVELGKAIGTFSRSRRVIDVKRRNCRREIVARETMKHEAANQCLARATDCQIRKVNRN